MFIEDDISRGRRRVGQFMVFSVVAGIAYFFSPGLPVLWAPRASASVKAEGKALFLHDWISGDEIASGDGLGPVYNATSCAACHSQGGIGGGGDLAHNVAVYRVMPSPRDQGFYQGLIHHFAVDQQNKESLEVLRMRHPIVPKIRKVNYNCTIRFDDFDPCFAESVNSTALFGAGWPDRISSKAIVNHFRMRSLELTQKELNMQFDEVSAGRPRYLKDGRVGKFGWKAQFATLKEFVAAACANELGLGNSIIEQARPLTGSCQASSPDLTDKQLAALTAFVDTLPRPVEILPRDPLAREAASRGKQLFNSVGCASCHVPDMGGVAGVYSDFLLHEIEPERIDNYGEPLEEFPFPSDEPKPTEWKTPALWGVADSAPYFHDGGSPTLEKAILRHAGQAKKSTENFKRLSAADRTALIAFLQTLRAPTDAEPVPTKSSNADTQLASNTRAR